MNPEIELATREQEFYRRLRRNHKIAPEVAALAAKKEVQADQNLRALTDQKPTTRATILNK